MNALVGEIYGSIKSAVASVLLNSDEDEDGLTVEEIKWRRLFRQVYCKQLHDWDCGLACCAMVLNWCKKDSLAVYDNDLAKKTVPLWTIELFFFLRQEGVQVRMCTLALGLLSHHHDIDWYSKINQEEDYINQLFTEAVEQRLPVEQQSLSIEELQTLLCDEHRTIAILLVDSLTISNKESSEAYAGHYIVVLKYDSWSEDFFYLNPAVSSGKKV